MPVRVIPHWHTTSGGSEWTLGDLFPSTGGLDSLLFVCRQSETGSPNDDAFLGGVRWRFLPYSILFDAVALKIHTAAGRLA